ncbi:hypothetical protein BD324DRAFT_201772 [Kockovaella imperatae]|uniref:Uncharacterized protein n=1 Tax=Kockovaella imperatae TaxID=4999 RepID=A0A1Y1U719_9TREE|nr:hypothetical protein BD324DRAFT_201772 [Kockovaella imperatae]ORX33820.1 hypothetical protein BD324DRAFT_201772 [Kockovaella imperatae]
MALGHPLPEIPDGSVWKQKAVRDAETQLVDRVKKGNGAHLFLLSLTRRMYLFAQYAVEHDDLLNYLGRVKLVV